MEQSAGIFLIRKDYKLFIGHPTKERPNKWSIPKGHIEEDEIPTQAAVREMYEESNINVSDWKLLHNLEPVKYKNKDKILIPYVLFETQNNFDFNLFEPKCNSNVPIEMGGYPEMDEYRWVTLAEARNLLYQSQVKCLDKIEEIIQKIEVNKSRYNNQ